MNECNECSIDIMLFFQNNSDHKKLIAKSLKVKSIASYYNVKVEQVTTLVCYKRQTSCFYFIFIINVDWYLYFHNCNTSIIIIIFLIFCASGPVYTATNDAEHVPLCRFIVWCGRDLTWIFEMLNPDPLCS